MKQLITEISIQKIIILIIAVALIASASYIHNDWRKEMRENCSKCKGIDCENDIYCGDFGIMRFKLYFQAFMFGIGLFFILREIGVEIEYETNK